MRLLIQRVLEAKVIINQEEFSHIGPGLLVLVGVHKEDDATEIKWFINRHLA